MNLTELQIEILKERFNIAVGHAATRYCEMTGGMRELTMSSPRLKQSFQKKLESTEPKSYFIVESPISTTEFRGALSIVATRRALLHFYSVYSGFECDETTSITDSFKSEIQQVVESFLNAAVSMLSFQLKRDFKVDSTQWVGTALNEYVDENVSSDTSMPFLVSIEYSPEGLSNEAFMCLKMQSPGLEQFGQVLQSSFELTDSSP